MYSRSIIIALLLGIFSACSPTGRNPELLVTESFPVETETAGPKVIPPAETAGSTTAPVNNLPESAASEPEMPSGQLAFIGLDGNVWLMDMGTGDKVQVTGDGRSVFAFTQEESFTYDHPAWSSDGRFLAFLQTRYTPRMDSTEIMEYLWIYDAESGESRSALESENLNGYAWRPGTHQLTYADTIDPNYFTARGTVDASLAKGILSLDVDSGEVTELVSAAGYALVNPSWSPDGRFAGFDEVIFMEGRGNFAYNEIESGDTIRWDRPIGNYDWSPDSSLILYDNLTYVPNGEESIFLNNPLGTDEKVLASPGENSYASMPRFSPDGSLAAYRIASLLEEGPLDTLVVLPTAGGVARQLAELEEIGSIFWVEDGKSLVITTGPYDTPRLVKVSIESGEIAELVDGWQPAWQPQPGP